MADKDLVESLGGSGISDNCCHGELPFWTNYSAVP